MKKRTAAAAMFTVAILATAAYAAHPGADYIKENGYKGPETCEECHPGKAKAFLDTVHWKHASKVTNVDGLDPKKEYGMQNRIYVMCNGNDIVNNLKEIPKNPETGKTKFSGCNTCHPGDHLNDVGSKGAEAEKAIDCLVCHSTAYDFRKRKPMKDDKGRVVMGQDRSKEAALAIGKPTAKNCMVCHEAAGGGVIVKRGFSFTKETDAHAAKGMVCVDCHKAKDHKIPTGTDPNNWANDGVRLSCADVSCHGASPHKDADLNRHTAKVACQTCHIPRTGGAFAKDFTVWAQNPDKFYEPTTLKLEANESSPVYAWYNGTVANTPHFIGPKGSKKDGKSKIYPFKIFQGKAFYNKKTGELLSMDFAPPMANGNTRAGVESAARTLGMKNPEQVAKEAVPGWQTIYFASSHLVTKTRALSCANCHAPNGVLNFKELGYSDKEVVKLTSPELFFNKVAAKMKEDW
ncbi:cytochrome C [Geomesophilobacter sediminis]|uniref:Cytochrome C n=1 Tax=Geomesophilobacter sediminis TaxID=2798584 RepID=A0A8J7M315_9BACT|nr:cytochrome C [Geomesophilobacter sediminis]MBJ6727738.1 cytochrome C [Geomesophilobacter sediminis]